MSCNASHVSPIAASRGSSTFSADLRVSDAAVLRVWYVQYFPVIACTALVAFVSYCAVVARHHGLVTLLPRGLAKALERPFFHTFAELYARITWFGNQIARLFVLVSMDLDETQRQDVLSGLDVGFRRRVCQQPLAQLLPGILQRILFGPGWQDDAKTVDGVAQNVPAINSDDDAVASLRVQALVQEPPLQSREAVCMMQPDMFSHVDSQQKQRSNTEIGPPGKVSLLYQVVTEKFVETTVMSITPCILLSLFRTSPAARFVDQLAEWSRCMWLRIQDHIRWAVNQVGRAVLASALCGALVVGAGGAIIGFNVGAFLGGVCGTVLAFATLGLSLPLGVAFGGCGGFCLGAAIGSATGFSVGGTVCYVIAYSAKKCPRRCRGRTIFWIEPIRIIQTHVEPNAVARPPKHVDRCHSVCGSE